MITRRNFLNQSIYTAAAIVTPKMLQTTLDEVEWMWSGALQPTSVRVNAKLRRNSQRVRLVISTRPDLHNPHYSQIVQVSEANHRVAKLSIWGLRPDVRYHYGVEVDGQLNALRGQLQTPDWGATSFAFAYGSCAQSGSSHTVFNTIRQQNPLFFLHMGDMHYFDIPTNDRNKYRHGFNTVLASSTQSALYRSVPLAYMWDDHDYGPNDSNGQFVGRSAARLSYQENVPHYPLAAGFGDVPIYQAFTMGRVRFILTDTRSMRDSETIDPDHPNKTILGAVQKAWLKRELITAHNRYPVVVWMCTSPWIADSPGSHIDNWNGFRAERRELANFIEQNGIKNLFYISGDSHQLAIDDGSNNRYSDSGRPSFPVMIAAALDQNGSSFGGNNVYSHGQNPNGGQFGLMRFDDNGDTQVRVRWSGRNAANQEITGMTRVIDSSVSPPTTNTAPVTSAELTTNASQVWLVAKPNSAESVTQTLQITGASIRWQATIQPQHPAWLSFAPKGGTTPNEIRFTGHPANLAKGVHAVTLKVTNTQNNKSIWLPVKLVVP